jgi:hypothetical protein
VKNEGTGNGEQGSGRSFVDPSTTLRAPNVSILRQWKLFSWQRFVGPGIILLAAFAAIVPQLAYGNSCGHDFDFHLVSWFDALHSWQRGIPYPHWAPSPNYGAGSPRFVFYPPLTWMLGAALGAVLPWTLVPIALTFLLLGATGLGTRALARQLLPDGPATLAGCAAVFSSYALFSAYERTAFAELTGGFWIPLMLVFALRNGSPSAPLLRRAFDGSAAPLALAIAGAWLSNDPVGVMACYLLAAVALTAALATRSWAPVVRAAAGTALGLALAAVYLVPAAWEERWVAIQSAITDPGQMIESSWIFARHADPALYDHDVVLHAVSVAGAVMFAIALAGLLICWRRGLFAQQDVRGLWISLAPIPFAILFLQFPVSLPLWNLLPKLRFVQFPWRWLVALEAPMGIYFAAAIWPQRTRLRAAVAAGSAVVFLGATIYAGDSWFQVCEKQDTVAAMRSVYNSGAGFEGDEEYMPRGAVDGAVATGLPQSCLVSDPLAPLGVAPADPDAPPIWSPEQHSCQASFAVVGDAGAAPEHLRIVPVAGHPGYLILRLLNYPAWRVRVNGRLDSSLPQREDGLIAVRVPEGVANVTVDWTATTDVIAGRWLSAIAVMALISLCVLERKLLPTRL